MKSVFKDMSEFNHYSVMLKECIDALNIKKDGIYVDATLGGGGHSLEIVKRLENGKLICIDRDQDALDAAKKRLEEYKDKIIFVKSNFCEIKRIVSELGFLNIDGTIFDLGVSSYQLDSVKRGFSYRFDAKLDMRMDKDQILSAYEVVNEYSGDELAKIIYDYSEEKNAKKIANLIVKNRPIETTLELSEVIKKAFSPKERFDQKHPAKRTFQAIRIEVNGELKILEKTIRDAVSLLNKEGRIVIMTFHSLEDRIVKNTLNDLATGCICDKRLPVCVCNRKPIVKLENRKPITASDDELKKNLRSKPAKLRVAQKL